MSRVVPANGGVVLLNQRPPSTRHRRLVLWVRSESLALEHVPDRTEIDARAQVPERDPDGPSEKVGHYPNARADPRPTGVRESRGADAPRLRPSPLAPVWPISTRATSRRLEGHEPRSPKHLSLKPGQVEGFRLPYRDLPFDRLNEWHEVVRANHRGR